MAVEFDPNDPLTIANPYPVYDRLRAEDPVHHHPAVNRWFLSRYADVSAALRESRMTARRPAPDLERLPPPLRRSVELLHQYSSRLVLNLDAPDHTRLRGVLRPPFAPTVVESLHPRIQEIAEHQLDLLPEGERLDVVHDFALPFVVTVFHELVGVPPEDRDQVVRWASGVGVALAGNSETPGRAEQLHHAADSMKALSDYVRPRVNQRRQQPRPDVLSRLAAATERGAIRDETELLISTVFLFVAGHRTTIDLIANGTLTLLRHPEQLQRLRDEPALMTSAIEELLRFESPVQTTARVATEDIEISGVTLRRGDMVMLGLGAANRDPERFAEPGRLDLARPGNRHLAFGLGPHHCLGAALARLQGQVALTSLLRRRPNLRLEIDSPVWLRLPLVRSLEALPVR